jgi:hypothetical protein
MCTGVFPKMEQPEIDQRVYDPVATFKTKLTRM